MSAQAVERLTVYKTPAGREVLVAFKGTDEAGYRPLTDSKGRVAVAYLFRGARPGSLNVWSGLDVMDPDSLTRVRNWQ